MQCQYRLNKTYVDKNLVQKFATIKIRDHKTPESFLKATAQLLQFKHGVKFNIFHD
jgi:hypothetical protein